VGDMLERIRANAAAGNAYDTVDGTPDPRLEPACERGDGRCEPTVMRATISPAGSMPSLAACRAARAPWTWCAHCGPAPLRDHGWLERARGRGRADCTLVADL